MSKCCGLQKQPSMSSADRHEILLRKIYHNFTNPLTGVLLADKHVQRPTHHGTLPDELLHQGDGGGDADADAHAHMVMMLVTHMMGLVQTEVIATR